MDNQTKLNKYFNELYHLLEDAENYGRSNNWPVQNEYPQYHAIRKIGEAICEIGGLEAMQAVYYAIRKEKFDLADNLNTMWHLCGDWTK